MSSADSRIITPSEENVSVQKCDFVVQSIVEWKGDELDDLSFSKGARISVIKQDGAGWACGTLEDGTRGWFPLDKVETIHDSAVAEIGKKTKPGETALDAFIKEAQENKLKTPLLNIKKQVNRNNSLNTFLSSKPMNSNTMDANMSAETAESLETAQKRLVKAQKKRKKERCDILIETLRDGWKPETPLDVTEDQFDRVVTEILREIPISKQKYHFSSYDDVFNGSALVTNLKNHLHRVTNLESVTSEQATMFAQSLLERNVIVDVADPGRKKFGKKFLYQLQSQQIEYSVLNLDKIYSGIESDGYKLSISLLGEIVNVMKTYLPNFEKLRNSKELAQFSLHLCELQQVKIGDMSDKKKKVFFTNLHNAMILYTHAKFSPPTNSTEKRFLSEHCSLYTNQRKYTLQTLESEVLKFVTKEDPMIFFTLSQCTKDSPAIFLFSTENYQMTTLYAIRHFLNTSMVVDESNYQITLPKPFQKLMKDLKFTDNEIIETLKPYAAKEQREHIEKMKTVGDIEIKFSNSDFTPLYVFEEASPLSPRT